MVYIKEAVWANRNQPKETKTDSQLANDLRYYGKNGEYLMKRISGRNYYERLGNRFTAKPLIESRSEVNCNRDGD
jgi:hypothetical protein